MPDECAQVLALKSITQINNDYRKKMAFLRVVDSSSYESHKDDISAIIPTSYGPVGGDYESFDKARNSYLESVQYTLDEQESLSVLQVQPPDGAIDAWLKCMRRDSDLTCRLDQQSDEVVRFLIEWDGGPGARTLYDCKTSIAAGIRKGDNFDGLEEFDGSAFAYFGYGPKTGKVIGTFSGRLHDGSLVNVPFAAARPIDPQLVTETIEKNIMGGVIAEVEFTAPYAQTVRLWSFATAHYEQEGDPSATFSVYVNGEHRGTWDKVQMHWPYPKEWVNDGESCFGQLVGQYRIEVPLKAAEKITLKAMADSQHAKNDNLYVGITYQRRA